MKSESKKSSIKSHLFGSNLELSSTGNINLICDKTNKINRTPTISISPNQTVTPAPAAAAHTPVNPKQSHVSNSGGCVVSSTKSSFVNKHLVLQRRKTIHDIINLDILTNLIHPSSPKNYQLDSKTKDKKILSSSSSIFTDSLKLGNLNQLKNKYQAEYFY